MTQHWRDLQSWTAKAHEEKDKDDIEKTMFPPCNVEWSQQEGSRFWCTVKSGGVHRQWVGVPRKLFYPGQTPRCACIRNTGPPSTDPTAKTNRGQIYHNIQLVSNELGHSNFSYPVFIKEINTAAWCFLGEYISTKVGVSQFVCN